MKRNNDDNENNKSNALRCKIQLLVHIAIVLNTILRFVITAIDYEYSDDLNRRNNVIGFGVFGSVRPSSHIIFCRGTE